MKGENEMDSKSFWTGYMWGDNTPGEATLGLNKKRPKTNIALQDVIWCQALSNIITELEDFVRSKRPSPEEFIRHLLPKHNPNNPGYDALTSIYTDEQTVAEYVEWIANLQKSQTLIDDNGNFVTDYTQLSAVRRIWQNPEHTPDFDNLDLIFSNSKFHKTILERNGRRYEYGKFSYSYILLDGLPKGFFTESPAANLIARNCNRITEDIIKKYGFVYSKTRSDYTTKNKERTPQSILRKKHAAYIFLRENEPDSCHSSWNVFSRLYDVNLPQATNDALSPEEQAAEDQELKKIYEAMGNEAVIYSSLNIVKDNKPVSLYFFLIVVPILITIGLTIALIIVQNTDSQWLEACWICSPILWVVGGLLCTGLNDEYGNFIRNVKPMRRAYYTNAGNIAAQEYARLLKYLT